MADQRLAGEIAVITGSDSGIGQATAIAFVQKGANVAVTYLERQGAEHTQKVVEEAGQKAIVVQLDQSKPENVEHLFQEVQNQLGTSTILVNDAGINSASTPVKL